MAREQHDREDLMREATALVQRGEFELPGYCEKVVFGFRRDGALSIYIGSDPVFQFNAAGELRRAYRRGLLLKSENGRLVSLERQRGPDQVALVRHDLSRDETRAVVSELSRHLADLQDCLQRGEYRLRAQWPPQAEIAGRLLHCLKGLPVPPRIADSPAARRQHLPRKRPL